MADSRARMVRDGGGLPGGSSRVQEFAEDNFNLNQIYDMNSRDVLFDNSVRSACIASCSFIYLSADESGYPRLQVIDAFDATGILDPITMMLTEGYAVLERDPKTKAATVEAYFRAEDTWFYETGKKPYSIKNPAPYPLLVPIILKPGARRPFGHSRLSRACMNIQQAALRTLKRMEISAEFYSFPQKYVLGTSPDADLLDKWKTTISSLLQIDKDEEGDKPTVGQFSQQSMTPFMEQLKAYASLFAGQTGLTLDDLGFAGANPSSYEAIKAAHENLRLAARAAQRSFSVGFLNAGYLAACIRDDYAYQRRQFYLTKALGADLRAGRVSDFRNRRCRQQNPAVFPGLLHGREAAGSDRVLRWVEWITMRF